MVPHQAVQEYETPGDRLAARAVQATLQDRVRLPLAQDVPRPRDFTSAINQRLHRQLYSRAPFLRSCLNHYWCFDLCDVSACVTSYGGVFGVRIQKCADGVSGFTIRNTSSLKLGMMPAARRTRARSTSELLRMLCKRSGTGPLYPFQGPILVDRAA